MLIFKKVTKLGQERISEEITFYWKLLKSEAYFYSHLQIPPVLKTEYLEELNWDHCNNSSKAEVTACAVDVVVVVAKEVVVVSSGTGEH